MNCLISETAVYIIPIIRDCQIILVLIVFYYNLVHTIHNIIAIYVITFIIVVYIISIVINEKYSSMMTIDVLRPLLCTWEAKCVE